MSEDHPRPTSTPLPPSPFGPGAGNPPNAFGYHPSLYPPQTQGSIPDGRAFYSPTPHVTSSPVPGFVGSPVPSNQSQPLQVPTQSLVNPSSAYPYLNGHGTYTPGIHPMTPPQAPSPHPFLPMAAPNNPSLPPLAVTGVHGGHASVNHPASGATVVTPAGPTILNMPDVPNHPTPSLVPLPVSLVASRNLDQHSVGPFVDSVHSHERALEYLLRERETLRALVADQVTKLDQLQVTVNELNVEAQGSLGGGNRRRATSKIQSNQYPLARDHVHEMYWKMLGVVEGDFVTLAQTVHDAAQDAVSQRQEVLPDWEENVDKPVNKRFFDAVAQCVYNNEKTIRDSNDAGRGTIEDDAFDVKILAGLVKKHHQYVRQQRGFQLTDAGRAKHEANVVRSKEYQRRATKLIKRLKAAQWVGKYKGMVGVDTMLDEECMSSAPDYMSDEGSEESTNRRTHQGSSRHGTGTRHRVWRTKKFVTLLWYLDRIAETEDLTEFTREVADSEQIQEAAAGEPVAKRQKSLSGRARRPRIIGTFYLSWKHANPREPKSAPPAGTVRKTWLKKYLETHSGGFETKAAPSWWKGWTLNVEELTKTQRSLLREIPSDVESETDDVDAEEPTAADTVE